jgi:hypothetical protein
MSSRDPRPDNRGLLLALTAVAALLTVMLVLVSRPPVRVVALAVVGAGLAAAGSVGVGASATAFRRWRAAARARPTVRPAQRTTTVGRTETTVAGTAAEAGQTRVGQPRAEPGQARAEPQQARVGLPRVDPQRLGPEQQLELAEAEYRQIQRDLRRLADKERHGTLTEQEAEFRQRLQEGLHGTERRIQELRRGLFRER